MTISKSRTDREFDKFSEVNGKAAVDVNIIGGSGSGLVL